MNVIIVVFLIYPYMHTYILKLILLINSLASLMHTHRGRQASSGLTREMACVESSKLSLAWLGQAEKVKPNQAKHGIAKHASQGAAPQATEGTTRNQKEHVCLHSHSLTH